MAILVTGCLGFIGSHVCSILLHQGKEIVGLSLGKGKADFTIYSGDIRKREEIETVFKENDIEAVVHLAGTSSIRNGGTMDSYVDTNIKGTAHLLEICREHDVKQIVFASSSTVYGRGNRIPFSEDEEVFPPSLYGLTKRAGELLCSSYYQRYSLPSVCLRFFTVYGERGREDMAIHTFTDLISQGKPIRRFGDGTSKRDYVHIEDVVESIIKVLSKKWGFEIINIGSGRATELNTLIKLVEKNVGRKAQIVEVGHPPEDAIVTQADISKAKQLLGWEPKTSIEEGIRKFVSWYKGRHG